MSQNSKSEYLLTCNSPQEAHSICYLLLAKNVVKTVELIDKVKLIIGIYADDVAKIGHAIHELTGRRLDFVKLPSHQESAEISAPVKIGI